MSTPESMNAFENFAKPGYAVIVFNNHVDAEAACRALHNETDLGTLLTVFSAEDVLTEISHRLNHQSMAEQLGMGFDLESLEQFLALAKLGCSFITVYVGSEIEEKRVLLAVDHHNARMIRKYGTFSIYDLPTTAVNDHVVADAELE